MLTRSERIEALTPRQALQVVQFMTAWLAERQTTVQDVSEEQQADGLNMLFGQMGYEPVSLPASWQPNEHAAGRAARELLHLQAESEDTAQLDELDEWLANPPEAANMALVELLLVPIVFAACTAILQTGYDFGYKDGRVTFRISRAGLKGKDLSNALGTLRGVFVHLLDSH
jgi:hypothetical protein